MGKSNREADLDYDCHTALPSFARVTLESNGAMYLPSLQECEVSSDDAAASPSAASSSLRTTPPVNSGAQHRRQTSRLYSRPGADPQRRHRRWHSLNPGGVTKSSSSTGRSPTPAAAAKAGEAILDAIGEESAIIATSSSKDGDRNNKENESGSDKERSANDLFDALFLARCVLGPGGKPVDNNADESIVSSPSSSSSSSTSASSPLPASPPGASSSAASPDDEGAVNDESLVFPLSASAWPPLPTSTGNDSIIFDGEPAGEAPTQVPPPPHQEGTLTPRSAAQQRHRRWQSLHRAGILRDFGEGEGSAAHSRTVESSSSPAPDKQLTGDDANANTNANASNATAGSTTTKTNTVTFQPMEAMAEEPVPRQPPRRPHYTASNLRRWGSLNNNRLGKVHENTNNVDEQDKKNDTWPSPSQSTKVDAMTHPPPQQSRPLPTTRHGNNNDHSEEMLKEGKNEKKEGNEQHAAITKNAWSGKRGRNVHRRWQSLNRNGVPCE